MNDIAGIERPALQTKATPRLARARPGGDATANGSEAVAGLATAAERLDRTLHAGLARLTLGLSPTALLGAYMDWAMHLAASPGQQLLLGERAGQDLLRLATYAWQSARLGDGAEPCATPLPQDRRFAAD